MQQKSGFPPHSGLESRLYCEQRIEYLLEGDYMHPNEELLERFYTSFQRKDSAGMAACYHPEITFSDPVFRDLKGPKAAAMWEMLTGRAKDMQITFRDIRADD